jgi:hypothetical protein
MKNLLAIILIFVVNVVFAQETPIPVPFVETVQKQVSSPKTPDEFKNLVWNKWDSENFIILSIDKNQGYNLKNKIENIKSWVLDRWGFLDINFKSDCKIVLVSNRDLLKKLFKLESPRCEVRKDGDKILLSAIWISNEDLDKLPYTLSEVCFSEIEQNYKKTLPIHIKKGMCYLNNDHLEVELKNTKKFTYENLISEKDPDEKQCAILCLLFRKEYGQDNFLKYVASRDINNFSIKNKENLESILNRYYDNFINDLKENKVPQSYLDVKRR